MSVSDDEVVIAFIGGGPRVTGLIERITANAQLVAPRTSVVVLMYDTSPAGVEHPMRDDWSLIATLGRRAEEITMFSDASCLLQGPVVTGPSLAEWIGSVRSGTIRFDPPDFPDQTEMRSSGSHRLPMHRIVDWYLRWFFGEIRRGAPENVRINEIRARVNRIYPHGDRNVLDVVYESGEHHAQPVDLVVLGLDEGSVDLRRTHGERKNGDTAGRSTAGEDRARPLDAVVQQRLASPAIAVRRSSTILDLARIPGSEPFARPGTNARFFRVNDRVARWLLQTSAGRVSANGAGSLRTVAGRRGA
ncbi:MAG TPA: FAD/NAD(P)-binding protein [Thermomicrobiales bacterium]|nr:FAD/NAD(P)-binding protein [Thermomicrobiales bacterium]